MRDAGCDHNAVFSLAYQRTTEYVAAWERANPSFFSDNPWLNHYDATFAEHVLHRLEQLARALGARAARVGDRVRRRRPAQGDAAPATCCSA